MHPNEELVHRFYTRFKAKDPGGMNACYHPEATFTDPVFIDLSCGEVKAMWRMLNSQAKSLEITFDQVTVDDVRGSAHWEATYPFSKSGRIVHNAIDAEFEFRDGLIYRHRDRFDLWKWTRMALGPTGTLLGWSGFLQNKVRKQARQSLDSYMRKNPG